jgi:hypothetical protein
MEAGDRVRMARALAMSPPERLAAMWRLLAEARSALEQHPDGREHFMRRNFRMRAIRGASERPLHDA